MIVAAMGAAAVMAEMALFRGLTPIALHQISHCETTVGKQALSVLK